LAEEISGEDDDEDAMERERREGKKFNKIIPLKGFAKWMIRICLVSRERGGW